MVPMYDTIPECLILVSTHSMPQLEEESAGMIQMGDKKCQDVILEI